MIFTVLIYFTTSFLAPEQPAIVKIENPDKSPATIVWHWEDGFTPDEKEKVRNWLHSVTCAVDSTVGPFLFDLHFHIHRRNNSIEPVPWANTRRSPSSQGVDFHIDPDFSMSAFMDDWTAPHEISHLSIPYLGRDHAWFAEGFASFMQYQVMKEMGLYTAAEVKEKYKSKLALAKPYYSDAKDFITTARDLYRQHLYPAMYWGSASFFIQLDETLRNKKDTSLPELVREYQICCRLKDGSIDEVIASWDRILGGTTCQQLLRSYGTESAASVFNQLDKH